MKRTKRFLVRVLPTSLTRLVHFAKNPESYRLRSEYSYDQDGLSTQHNCDFMEDPKFLRAYQSGESTGSWDGGKIHWRAHVACWAAEKAKNLDGDFVECGVNKGGLALTVIRYTEFQNLAKTFYLLDTFSGLPEEYISDQEKAEGRSAGGYEECYEEVRATFAPFRNVVIVKGAVPETLDQVKSEAVAYLSLDMNCVAPEIAAAEFFWKKLVSGAVILLDDYGWAGHLAQKQAFDQFAAEKNVPILSLPTGQGMIVKP